MIDTTKTLHSFQGLKEVKAEFEKSAQKAQEESQKRYLEAKKFLEQLKSTYPIIFNSAKPLPLAIGIEKEIAKRHPESSRAIQKLALSLWTRREKYLNAVIAGENRHTLDGAVAGTIQNSEKEYSQAKLERIAAAKQARKNAHKNNPGDNSTSNKN